MSFFADPPSWHGCSHGRVSVDSGPPSLIDDETQNSTPPLAHRQPGVHAGSLGAGHHLRSPDLRAGVAVFRVCGNDQGQVPGSSSTRRAGLWRGVTLSTVRLV